MRIRDRRERTRKVFIASPYLFKTPKPAQPAMTSKRKVKSERWGLFHLIQLILVWLGLKKKSWRQQTG